ncbi:cell surface glycoprotein CD200 receptor 1 [Arapaima gigas]
MENLFVWIYIHTAFSVTFYLAQVTGDHSGISLVSDGTFVAPRQETSPPMIHEHRTEYFDLNSSVNLTCTNKTLSSVLFATWYISTNNTSCLVAVGTAQESKDTCQDGKELCNMTSGEIYLHIPHFAQKDEGRYRCEIVYKRGSHTSEIQAKARASLNISIRVDRVHRVAVCSATGAKAGASILWRPSQNLTGNQSSTQNPDGTYNLESCVSLSEVDGTELECIVTHPSQNMSRTEKLGYGPSLIPWLWILTSICSICFLTGVLTGLYIIRKHLSKIRNRCKLSLSHPPPPHTTVKPQDVDELEPYASYVQRVNSIYNSSAELCSV